MVDATDGSAAAHGGASIDGDAVDRERIEAFGSGPDGRDFIASLASLFEADVNERLAELSAALQRRDAGQVKQVAHALKGAAMNLGAPRIAELAREAEQAPLSGVDHAAELRRELRRVMAAFAEWTGAGAR